MVDYVMVSEGIQDQVLHFKVTDFIPTLSDAHCKLEWTMSAYYLYLQKFLKKFYLFNCQIFLIIFLTIFYVRLEKDMAVKLLFLDF